MKKMRAGMALELSGISKTFGVTCALRNVGFSVPVGEVHAIIGENGAGKSTLMKILSGAYRADAGRIRIEGRECVIDSPAAGRVHGIAMIYQELTLVPHLTVAENMTLGMESTRYGFIRRCDRSINEALGLLGHAGLSCDTKVGSLTIGIQQIVEIARALVSNARIIIMDEPTSSLSSDDTRVLFNVIRRLKSAGISIIYISHFLEEVMEVADSYTVLRDGESAGTGKIAGTDISKIIKMMTGRTLNEMFPHVEHKTGDVLLKVTGLTGANVPRGISFELHRGEILGIAGLIGAGRSETLRGIFGLDKSQEGWIAVSGRSGLSACRMRPWLALKMGVDYLSENRKEEGLAEGMSVASNVTMSSLNRFAGLSGYGILRKGRERTVVQEWIRKMNIRCEDSTQRVSSLSGGNQQKVAVARMLEMGRDIVLLDEPTRGIDVGSKVDIYKLIGNLAAEGKGVIFVSSYLPELLGICDTVGVMHRGVMSAVRPVSEWTEHDIMMTAMSGSTRV